MGSSRKDENDGTRQGEGKLVDQNVSHAALDARRGACVEDALTSSSLTVRGSPSLREKIRLGCKIIIIIPIDQT